MTPDDFRALLDSLEMSQLDAGRLLRVDGRTVRRWCSGDAPIPFSAYALLRLLLVLPGAEKAIRDMEGL